MKPFRSALFGALLVIGPIASAHHSFAMYDSQKLVTVIGTVKMFQWANPHVILWLESGADAGGEAELWTLELPTSPGVLTRIGWNKHSLETGDRVTVQYNPLRNGERGGSFKKATLIVSGKVLELNPGTTSVKADAK